MVLFNSIEMILQENNNTKVQLKKWYKNPAGQYFKKILLNELESIKDLYQGNEWDFEFQRTISRITEMSQLQNKSL